MNATLSLCMISISCVAKSSGICIDAGIMFVYWVTCLLRIGQERCLKYSVALYQLQGYRVVSSNLSIELRLLVIFIWGYILWVICGPLMVTAQYGCLPAVYIVTGFSWGWILLRILLRLMAVIGCRK